MRSLFAFVAMFANPAAWVVVGVYLLAFGLIYWLKG